MPVTRCVHVFISSITSQASDTTPQWLVQLHNYTYTLRISLRVPHSIPVHPATQVQVSTAVHLPLFRQGLEHNAVFDGRSSNDRCTQHISVWWTPVAYKCTEVHSHSTVHLTDRFYCLIPAVCSLHHRCRSLQSCGLYWRDCVGHSWEYQDHHNPQLEIEW